MSQIWVGVLCTTEQTAAGQAAGGLIHILLVVAVMVVLLRVIQGRNPLRG
jgi:hypothetical protein